MADQLSLHEPFADPPESPTADASAEQLASIERAATQAMDVHLVRLVITAAVRAKTQDQAEKRFAEIAARQGFFVERVQR